MMEDPRSLSFLSGGCEMRNSNVITGLIQVNVIFWVVSTQLNAID